MIYFSAILSGMAALKQRIGKRCTILFPAVGMLLVLFAAWPQGARGAEALHTSVGFSSSTFLDVSKDRAQAITALWARLVARKWGGTASTRVCSSLPELEKDIRSKEIDLVVLLPAEYLQMKGKVPLEPLFVSAKQKEVYDRLILVVRRDSGISSLSDLKGKTLIQQKGIYPAGLSLWLDTLLMRKEIRDPKRFFSKVRESMKPSSAILHVFFRHVDACVVTQSSFLVMTELNPQLDRELLILEKSPPRPSSIIAVRKGLSGRHRKSVHEILDTLDQSPEGKQLLTLFRMNRLVPFRSEYLLPLEGLFRENKDLKLLLTKRSP